MRLEVKVLADSVDDNDHFIAVIADASRSINELKGEYKGTHWEVVKVEQIRPNRTLATRDPSFDEATGPQGNVVYQRKEGDPPPPHVSFVG